MHICSTFAYTESQGYALDTQPQIVGHTQNAFPLRLRSGSEHKFGG